MALVYVNKDNFEGEVINSENELVLVDFWAEWCGPCQLLNPIVEELSRDPSQHIKVCKVNVDTSPDLADRFQIFSIPTVLFFSKGKLLDRIIGYVPKSTFLKKVNEIRQKAVKV